MIHWNPVPHIQHAWSDTKTVWGKIALPLFYALIWVGILTSAWSVLFPGSQGAQCWLDNFHKDASAQLLLTAMIRGINIIFIGFLLYADVGGLQFKNVAMVTIFIIAYVLAFVPVVQMGEELGCGSSLVQMWICPSWAVVALIFTWLDDKMADRGTEEENTSLTV